MSRFSLGSIFKSKTPEAGGAPQPEAMAECPRCGRFFQLRGHEHEPFCKDCWKLKKMEGAS
jgi:hypothetical protein